jgi:hypothetical protein
MLASHAASRPAGQRPGNAGDYSHRHPAGRLSRGRVSGPLLRRSLRNPGHLRDRRSSHYHRGFHPSPIRRGRASMNDHHSENIRLLYGPYRAPKCRVGWSLECEARGRTVIVAGISDAPIQWHYAKNRDNRSLILCGNLVNAVAVESVAAVCHHWVSHAPLFISGGGRWVSRRIIREHCGSSVITSPSGKKRHARRNRGRR